MNEISFSVWSFLLLHLGIGKTEYGTKFFINWSETPNIYPCHPRIIGEKNDLLTKFYTEFSDI
jgi:hypothetical protein